MKPGRYAASDGSFGRSAGGAVGRGVALLAVALLIGIVLLNSTDTEPPGTRVATGPEVTDGTGDGDGDGDGGGGSVATIVEATPTTLPTRAPKDVKIVVANAAGVQGVAGRVKDQLVSAGYNVVGVTNLPNGASAVFLVPEYEADAAAVAVLLRFPSESVRPMTSPPPVTDTKGAQVIVVVGPDQAPNFSATTTTSTARPASPSTSVPATTTTKKP